AGVQRYTIETKPKSDLYRDLIPAVNGGLVELLDPATGPTQARVVSQLLALERHASRQGKDAIAQDHSRRGAPREPSRPRPHPAIPGALGQHDDARFATWTARAIIRLRCDPKPVLLIRGQVPGLPRLDSRSNRLGCFDHVPASRNTIAHSAPGSGEIDGSAIQQAGAQPAGHVRRGGPKG